MRRLGKWSSAACALVCAAALLAVVGCGGGERKGATANVAALNAELAMRETALEERLVALEPDAVTGMIAKVRAMVDDCEMMEGALPPDESASRSALVTILARFRSGAEALVAEIAEADGVASGTRAEIQRCRSRLDEFVEKSDARLGELAGEPEEFINTLSDTFGETRRQLAGWRAQRIEKMEASAFATFPAFYAAAVERYGAWEDWVSKTEAVRKEVSDCVWPVVSEASSNMMALAAIVRREDTRAAEALARLRAMPPDPALVADARRAALAAYDAAVGNAGKVMSSNVGADFPATARARAAAFIKKANSLEADVNSFVAAHGDYLGGQARKDASDAMSKANASHKKILSATGAFEMGMESLRRDWAGIETDIPAASVVADSIRKNTNMADEALAEAISTIDALRKRIEASRIAERRESLDAARTDTLALLSSEEGALAAAERKFAAAKTKAMSDEKTAKWNAEKKSLKATLENIRTTLRKPPQPGYTRPESEAGALKKTVEGILSRIDAMPESDLRAAVRKAQTDAKGIEDRTKWTPGTRHPSKPHVFAMEKEHMWDADPGYWFDHPGENSDLVVSWRPGQRHHDHSHISAGQSEGTWVPDPGYKARWNGDLDPVWTKGERHPRWPHIYADEEERKWTADPGYEWASSNDSDFSVRWKPGARHPTYEGIESAQQEGRWNTLPGWVFVNPGSSDLRTRWVPGSRYPGRPHIHASAEKWKWSADDGYDFDEYNSSNLDVHWSPGKLSADGQRRARRQEGQFETKHNCPACIHGYKTVVVKCQRCRGRGELEADYVSHMLGGEYKPCPGCRGNGKFERRTPCTQCNGAGYYWQ